MLDHEMSTRAFLATPARELLESIRVGDRVTITNRYDQERTGRAVMRGPHGWVLNMGGRHGTPAIATETNILRVSTPKVKL